MMQKRDVHIVLTWLVLLALLLFTQSCDLLSNLVNARVRFWNDNSGTSWVGVRYGSAEYDGLFVPGQITEYFAVAPGQHTIQTLDSQGGLWTPWTNPPTVAAGVRYTIRFYFGTRTDGSQGPLVLLQQD
jgi:hypothetical protein